MKLAIIGAGNMAHEHARAFRDIETVSLVGIFSRTRSRAETLATKHKIQYVCNSVEELWELTNADLVVISVGELFTNEICRIAFAFPWYCLIEKPAGYNLYDAESILKHAEKTNAKAYVALNRRHYSSTRIVMQELSQLTEPRIVHVLDQEDPQAALDNGEHPSVTANWMYANSIHVIDYLRLFCRGKVISVNHIIPWNAENPFLVLTKLDYSSGDIGIYQGIWNAPGPWAVAITTPTKRFEMRPLEHATLQMYGSRKNEPLPLGDWDTQFKPGLRQQSQESFRAVKGEVHGLPTLQEGFETMKLIHQIYQV